MNGKEQELNLDAGVMDEGKVEQQSSVTSKTAGTLLREARENAGLELPLLASMLKVSVRQLEQLEADQYDELPDTAFIRGVALAVGKRLKIDTQEILDLLPQLDQQLYVKNRLDQPLTPTSAGKVIRQGSFGKKKRSGALWLVFLLLLVAVFVGLYLFVPMMGERGEGVNQAGTQAVDVGQQEVALPLEALPPLQEEQEVINTEAVAEEESQSEEGATETEEIAAVAKEELTMTTRTKSWVTVRDSENKVLADRMLSSGETLMLELVNLPFKVRLGNAVDVSVVLRGSDLDLSAKIVNGVANFEIE